MRILPELITNYENIISRKDWQKKWNNEKQKEWKKVILNMSRSSPSNLTKN